MKKINECVETDDLGKVFLRTEKGKSFTLLSDRDFNCKIVAIDKCVFKDEPIKKCDFLFIVPKSKGTNPQVSSAVAYYVELKGDDLREVCKQLFNAIEKTKAEIPNHRIEARIVSTKGAQPRILNSEYYKKVKKIIGRKIVFCRVHKGNNYNHKETLI